VGRRGLFQAADAGDVVSDLVVSALGVSILAIAVIERVEIAPDRVRVIRVFSSRTVARADLDAVLESGGRGRPPMIALRPGATGELPADHTGRRALAAPQRGVDPRCGHPDRHGFDAPGPRPRRPVPAAPGATPARSVDLGAIGAELRPGRERRPG
jgi:hypothetical protein